MSLKPKACPRCGSTRLIANGGVESHSTGHGWAHVAKGVAHRNPIDLAMGLTTLGIRMVNPLRFTCHNGHVFRA